MRCFEQTRRSPPGTTFARALAASESAAGPPTTERAGAPACVYDASKCTSPDDDGGYDCCASADRGERPPCAGVGDPDTPAWLRTACAGALCARKDCMPQFALANWNWGGRLHPLYTDLSATMQTLLGLAVLVCRMIVLQYADAPEEQEKGFTGNTILLAQPTPERLLEVLPPAEADVGRSISVCFNSQHVTRAQVGAQKALADDPDLYVRCVRLRQDARPRICRRRAGPGPRPSTAGAGACPARNRRRRPGQRHAAHVHAGPGWTSVYARGFLSASYKRRRRLARGARHRCRRGRGARHGRRRRRREARRARLARRRGRAPRIACPGAPVSRKRKGWVNRG